MPNMKYYNMDITGGIQQFYSIYPAECHDNTMKMTMATSFPPFFSINHTQPFLHFIWY